MMTATASAETVPLKFVRPAEGEVSSLSKITVQFDGDLDVSSDWADGKVHGTLEDASGNILFTTSQYDVIGTGTDGNYNAFEFTLTKPITKEGTYTFNFPAGAVKHYSGESGTNEAFSVVYTVKEGSQGEYPALSEATFLVQPASGSALTDTEFSNGLTLTFPDMNLLCSTSQVAMTGEDGASYTADLQTGVLSYGMAKIQPAEVTKSGKYTIVIPEGTFYDQDYADSEGKGGKRNLEQTLTYDITVEGGGGPVITTPLEITKLTVQNPDSEVVDLLQANPSLHGLLRNAVVTMTTNQEDAGYIYMTVKEDVEDADILSYIELYKGEDGVFKKSVYSNTIFDTGKTYVLDFEVLDTDKVAPTMRKHFGTYSVKVAGSGHAYKFSEATLVSVEPAPGTEILDPNTKFVYTFSEPVNVDKNNSGFVQGQGFMEDFYSIESTADRTRWTFQVNPNTLKDQTPEFYLSVGATDDNGMRLKGNSGFEGSSCFMYAWDCYLGAGDIIAVPVYEPEVWTAADQLADSSHKEGMPTQLVYNTVDEISGFYVFPGPNEPAGIALGFSVAPYVATMSGTVVSTADFNNGYEPIYKEEDKDNMDAKSIAYRFKLKKAVTAPGKYRVVFPSKSINLGTQFEGIVNKHYEYTLVIEGTPEVTGCSIAEGDALNQVGVVSFYTPADVEAPEGAKMRIENEEGNIASVDVSFASTVGGTMIIGDFASANDGKAIALEDGVDYTITVPANRIFLTGTEMALPKMSVNFKGLGAGAQTVALTHSVSGNAVSVAKVVKGEPAELNLTPAADWKVDKVTFNGTDVTDQVANNKYTTPALDSDAIVAVDLAYDGFLAEPVGIDDVVTDFKVNVWSEGGKIMIRGLENGVQVSVYTLNGALIRSFQAADSSYAISVAPDTYVITLAKDGKSQGIKVVNK